MNSKDKLKLMIYESLLSNDEQNVCIESVELSSNDSFQNTYELIRLIIEAAENFSIKKIDIHDKEAREYIKQDKSIFRYFDTQLLKNCNGEVIINEDNGDLIGFVFVADKKDKGFISNLIVQRKYRRRGFGSVLLLDAINKYHGYDLTVKRNNTPAIKLYEKYGFKEIHHDKMKDTPLIWMKKPSNRKLLKFTKESVSSKLDNNYKSKDHLKLTDFKCKRLVKSDLSNINREGTMLKHLDLNDDCYGWFYKNSLVGYVAIKPKEKHVWITALEVLPEYQSHGLGTQIVSYAVNKLHANRLTVSKKNNIAIKMYEDIGFVRTKDKDVTSDAMIVMKI